MKLDAIYSSTLVGILDELNRLEVQKENIINIFQSSSGDTQGKFIAIFYS